MHLAGFLSPTPIQAQTWPVALQNRDVVAIAKTGSGKTLGYLVPAFILLRHCRNNPQFGPTVLVLAPTRELATQIQDEAIKFGSSSRVSCTVSSNYSLPLMRSSDPSRKYDNENNGKNGKEEKSLSKLICCSLFILILKGRVFLLL